MVSDGRGVGVASAGRVLTSRHDLSGGKKSDTQMGSNGSSWNTKDQCSHHRMSLFRATWNFTMMVGFCPHTPGTSSVVAWRPVERCLTWTFQVRPWSWVRMQRRWPPSSPRCWTTSTRRKTSFARTSLKTGGRYVHAPNSLSRQRGSTFLQSPTAAKQEMTSEEKGKITDLKKCNFSEMHQYFKAQSEARKAKTKEEKLVGLKRRS